MNAFHHTPLINSNTVAIIDSNLPDLPTLCAGLPANCAIVWLDERVHGLDDVAQQLSGYASIQTLHLITHGAPGRIFVGNTTLSLESLPEHHHALTQISQAMTAEAQWFIYGCEVAQGSEGKALIDALGSATGVTIAAATHKVGHAELGGSWELDAKPSVMENALHVSEWRGVLAPGLESATFLGTLADGKIILSFDVNLSPVDSTMDDTLIEKFVVKVNGQAVQVVEAIVGAQTVTLTLETPPDLDDYVTIAYTGAVGTYPNRVEDLLGNPAADFGEMNVISRTVVVTTAQTQTRDGFDLSESQNFVTNILVKTDGSLIVPTDSNPNTADAIRGEMLNLGIQTGATVSAADYAIEINNADSAIPVYVTNYGTLSATGADAIALKTITGQTNLVNGGTITGNVLLDDNGDDMVAIVQAGKINGYIDAGETDGDYDVLELLSSSDRYNEISDGDDYVGVGNVESAPWVFDLRSLGATGTYRNFEAVWSSDSDVTLIGDGDIDAELDNSYGGTLKIGDTLEDNVVTAGVGTLTTKDLYLSWDGEGYGTVVFNMLGGSVAGTDYDQIVTTGEVVTLGGSLELSLGEDFSALVDDEFILINNTSSDVVIEGTFTDAEGEPLTEIIAGGYTFSINYAGGTDENDVVLKVTEVGVLDETAPVITSTPVTTVDEGAQYSYTLSATDDNDVTWSVKEGETLPEWLTLGKGDAAFTIADDFTDPGGMAYDDETGDIYATYNSLMGPEFFDNGGQPAIYKIAEDGTKTLFTNVEPGQVGSMVVDGDYLYAGFATSNGGNILVRYDLTDTSGDVTPEVILQSIDDEANNFYYSHTFTGLAKKGGFLYAADTHNGRILEFDLSDISVAPVTYVEDLVGPYGIVFDADGNLYGTDLYGASVFKFDGTDVSIVMSINGAGAQVLHGVPTDIKIDADGNFYISHFGMFDDTTGIYKYNSDFVEQDPISEEANTWSMIINSEGKIIAGDVKFNDDGTITGEIFGIDTANYSLTGTPDYEDAGEYEITLVATDEAGNETEHTFTITVNDVPDGLSSVTTSHTFTETELQAEPQLLDTDVTFRYDNDKLSKIDSTHYATLYVNYVYIVPESTQEHYDAINQTYYDPATPGGYTNYEPGNNRLEIKSNGLLEVVDDDGDYDLYYNEEYLGRISDSNNGFYINFNETATPTAEIIEKIIESITLSVNDYPTEQTKIRIVVKDNTGATTDPVYVDVSVSAENDAPVLSTSVGLLRSNVTSDAWDQAYSVATINDGLIVAGGSYSDRDSVKITKYDTNGAMDSLFGTNGVITIAFDKTVDYPSVAVDSNNKIIVAFVSGIQDPENSSQWATIYSIGVMRYNADGTLDTTFATSTNNMVKIDIPTAEYFEIPKLAILSDNSIAVSIGYQNQNYSEADFTVAKITSAGVLDSAFGTDGLASFDINNLTSDETADIAVSGSNIILTGTVTDTSSGDNSVGVAILNATTGAQVQTIATGVTSGDVWSSFEEDVQGNAVAVQTDGKIIVAGSADWEGMILARYALNEATWELDTTFGTNGKVASDLMDGARDVVVDSSGKILVLSDDENMLVARFNSNGTLDTTFGTNGVAEITASTYPWAIEMKIATDGTIWLVGGDDDADDGAFNIAKLSANGIADATFGTKATYTTYGDPILLDGGISVFDGELSDYDNDDYYFNGATLTLAREGGANALDIFSAAEDSDLSFVAEGSVVEYDGYEVGTFTNAGGQLSITFNDEAEPYLVNSVMQSIAYKYGDDTVAQPSDINLVWKFNDGNTGEEGRTDQGSGGAKQTTLVQTLNIAIGEPVATNSVTLNVANPFTPNDAEDSTPITIDAPEGINIASATNSAVSGLPKNVKMPLGQFGFTLSGLENGATVDMSMTADADFKQFSYFKKNLVTNKWVNIAEGTTINDDGTATVKFSLTDGGVFDADRIANGVIVDPGGVGENALLPIIAENTTEVGNVSLLDEDAASGTLSYAITGGADAAKFAINSTTGLLSFNSAPNYEIPTDAGDTAANNTYAVQVTVTGSTSGSEVQNLIVTVLNVAEDGDNLNTAPVIVGLRAEAQGVTVGTAAALDDIRVVDADGDTMMVTLSATNGSIGGLTDADANTAGIQLTGDAATINTALAAATFTATAAGAAGISISVVDTPDTGTPITTTGYYAMTAAAAPSGGGGGGGSTPTPTSPPTQAPTTTTVDGATVTTGTTTTPDGRVLEMVTITPITGDRQDSTGDGSRADIALYYGDGNATIPATTASLPTGVGLTATGARTPANNTEALNNLVKLINDTAGTEEASQNNLTGGGENFLNVLNQQAEKGPLIVNSVKLTVGQGVTSAPAQPITIQGSADVVAGTTGRPIEAIVIDVRDLPKGTKLELKNVEFAVIVGDGVEVIGGDGANIVYAGSGSQTIILGEEDDELYGGDGDDWIGSKSGDDKLFGDAGNDVLFGGTGNDALTGGTETDIALFKYALNEYQIRQNSDGSWTISHSIEGTDTLKEIEFAEFADQTISLAGNNQWLNVLFQQNISLF